MNKETAQLLERHFDTAFAAPDGIKKLRELILTLAMQGKLVEQGPNDQPTSELLKEITAEKRRLVKEGKIKLSKPLPEIKPEEVPYELPQGWKWVRLDDISNKIHYGYTASANHDIQNVRLLRITDIQGNKVDWQSVPGCDAKKKDISQYLLADNDILIARTGGTVGKSYLVQGIDVDAVFASYLIRIVPSSRIDVRFLKYFAEGPLYWKQLYAACSGTGQPNVNGTSLSQLFLALPPVSEQQRIVTQIDQLMARCDELEKLRAERDQKRLAVHTAALKQLLAVQDPDSFVDTWQFITQNFGELYSVKENVAELRKAILQLAVMGKLVPQNPNDPPASELLKEIEAEKRRLVKEGKIKKPKPLPLIKPEEVPCQLPQGWKWVRLGNLNPEYQNGISKRGSNDGRETIVLRLADVVGNEVSLEDTRSIQLTEKELEKYLLNDGNILITRVNGSVDLVGSFIRVRQVQRPFAYCDHFIRMQLPMKFVDVDYLHVISKGALVRRQIEGRFVTTAGQKTVNQTHITTLVLPLPPLPEQHRIVARIDQLMALCDTLDQQIDTATGKQTELLNAVMALV